MSVSTIFYTINELINLAIRDTHSPKLWMDAGLAAYAIASGFEMVTTDKAFKQFKGLQLRLILKGK